MPRQSVRTNNKSNTYFRLIFVAKLFFKTSIEIDVLVNSIFDLSKSVQMKFIYEN